MNPVQNTAFDDEMTAAKALMAKLQLEASLRHLERAHIIGQAFVVPHVTSHWWMLRVELRRRRPLAVIGQMVRIVLGALGSALGRVPTGNTGGTDISMFKRLPVEPGLQKLIDGISTDSPAG